MAALIQSAYHKALKWPLPAQMWRLQLVEWLKDG